MPCRTMTGVIHSCRYCQATNSSLMSDSQAVTSHNRRNGMPNIIIQLIYFIAIKS